VALLRLRKHLAKAIAGVIANPGLKAGVTAFTFLGALAQAAYQSTFNSEKTIINN
jgi:hypothetical protein